MNAPGTSRRGAARHRGLAQLEMLVAMAIAVCLLGGLYTIVENARRTYLAESALAQLHDRERLAMTRLADVIRSAGDYPDPVRNAAATSLPAGGGFASAGQGLFGTSGATPPGDTVSLRFVTASGDARVSCTGGSRPSGADRLDTVAFSVDAALGLVCALNGAPPVPLVAGISSLQVLYGVKTDFSVENGAVDSYLSAAQMRPADWSHVIVVNVTLAFQNPLAGQPGQPATIPFQRTIAVMAQSGVRT